MNISDGDASTHIVSAVIDYDHSGQSVVLFAEDTGIITLMAGKHGRCRRSNGRTFSIERLSSLSTAVEEKCEVLEINSVS